MASRKSKQANADANVSGIASLIRRSLLPGDAGFSRDALAEAAQFAAATAQVRKPEEPAIAVETLAGTSGHRQTRVCIVNDDMPFLVDSIAGAIAAHGLGIDRLVHPLAHVARDDAGRLVSLAGARKPGAHRESIVYVETARADARTRVRLRTGLAATLAHVRAAVTDWPKLQAAMLADAALLDEAGADEDAALLRWMKEGMLTQLGHMTCERDGKCDDRLGICRVEGSGLMAAASFDRAFAWFERDRARALLIVKSNQISQVHRRVPLDLFIVPVRRNGKLAALSVHAGVWTSAALAMPPALVPRLRTQLDALMARLGFDPASHDGKALVHALTRLPHDLLIAFDQNDLERVATTMMSVIDRPRPRVVLVQAPLRRHLFAFVWLPRDALSTAVRLEIAAMLERAAAARVLDWSLEVEGSNLASLRFVLDIRDGAPSTNEAALDSDVRTLVRGWMEDVAAELALSRDPSRAAALASRYAEAFPLAYRTSGGGAAEAARDITCLRDLPARNVNGRPARGVRIDATAGAGETLLRLKLYQRDGAIALSDAVPMLENFGFRVVSEMQTLLENGALGAIHEFAVEVPAGATAMGIAARGPEIERAIADVLNGASEDDAFNRLIVSVGLGAPEADWLRAWFAYLRQAGTTYSTDTAMRALQMAPEAARGLVDLFVARHDPDFSGDRERAAKAAGNRIDQALANVSAINDDRLLRRYRAIVEAIVRTNAFSSRLGPDVVLAFKFDSALVPGLPRPVPWREIFVYSRRVEGIHLRAGPIARGGLRWSDRRDDFRTEVLGLMKAQRVKNAVIVPTGAKGGFYPKQLPDPQLDRDGWLAEGRASYALFVRTLLSLTDNLAGKRVVHPRGMVIRDGDDPYFVVAADKGTASYSDLANAIAAESDFWLDDAFASGGSKGYDHKAMGITARGAWISVQRHFMEMGVDVQADPVRVAGCGDMSGDVFGNGMLLSKAVKLVAAFDHRHIFLDPDPDPAASWKERKRLFKLPRSSWDDYDKKRISKGGGVFPRSQKVIPVSAEVREMLDLATDAIDPEALISAILQSRVDLLWFGGIGTYIKAAQENNVQVGDPANDALRVDGQDVRARVIGEGANLGCTQAGRIEYALRGAAGAGGRINTDFIDNSAGVDCSDNEVNIKIALAAAKRDGRLDEPGRVRLLAAMTEEVAALVLEDNRLQSLALSLAQFAGPAATPSHVRLIEMLEDRGFLDRRTEGFGESDGLIRRAADGQGLTRPELAVLLSCAKLALQDALEHSGIPADPGMMADLLAAFPAKMRKRFGDEILEHRLRNEIISTKLANRLINRLGLIQPFELVEEEGATLAQVTAAFTAAEKLFDMAGLWAEIDATVMPERARLLLLDRAARALRPQIADLLRAGAGPVPASQLATALNKGIAELRTAASALLGAEARGQSKSVQRELLDAGAPEALANRIARILELDGAVGIAAYANETGSRPKAVARGFIAIGEVLGLDWAQTAAAQMNPSDPWERLLVSGIARDFQQMRLDFLRRSGKSGDDPQTVFETWRLRHKGAVGQFRDMTDRARATAAVTPAMLAQLAGHARNLLMR